MAAIRPDSTYFSDPAACFTVSSMSENGCGIQGYYTNEWAANAMRRWCIENGHTHVSVDPYDPKAPTRVGMHPLVRAALLGY